MSVMSEGAELAIGSTAVAEGLREPSIASVGDYIALMKPRVMSLIVLTSP